MKLLVFLSLALLLSGCANTHEGESYGSIATKAFLEGFIPDRDWVDNTTRVTGRAVGTVVR